MNLQFRGKYLIEVTFVCETGLHIGGSTEGFEIGGVDNPVIKDPLTNEPYIPGSSLKGKLRHLLEWSQGHHGFTEDSPQFTIGRTASGAPTFQPCSCGQCAACVLFGVTPESGVREAAKVHAGNGRKRFSVQVEIGDGEKKTYFITGPARLTVRDAFLLKEQSAKAKDEETKKEGEEAEEDGAAAYYTAEELEHLLGEDLYTEVKMENTLNRVTSEANPRPMERVPPRAAFKVEMIVDVYREEDGELLRSLFTAMHLLEQSALGGSGTRGYGKGRFTNLNVRFRPVVYYRTGDVNQEKTVLKDKKTVQEIVQAFDTFDWPMGGQEKET